MTTYLSLSEIEERHSRPGSLVTSKAETTIHLARRNVNGETTGSVVCGARASWKPFARRSDLRQFPCSKCFRPTTVTLYFRRHR